MSQFTSGSYYKDIYNYFVYGIIAGSYLQPLIHSCIETNLTVVCRVQLPYVFSPTECLWQAGKCVGECKFEVMCLRKTDGDGAMGMGARVEREKAGWRTAGDRQTLIVMALISASLAPSFHMGSDILLLLHPLHLAGGVGSSLGCAARSDGKSLPNTGPLTYKLHH